METLRYIARRIVKENLRSEESYDALVEAFTLELERVQKESLAAESQVLKTLRRQNTHLLEELKLVSFHLPRDRTSTGIAGIIMNAEFEQRCAYYEDKIKRLKDMIDNIRIAPVEQVSDEEIKEIASEDGWIYDDRQSQAFIDGYRVAEKKARES